MRAMRGRVPGGATVTENAPGGNAREGGRGGGRRRGFGRSGPAAPARAAAVREALHALAQRRAQLLLLIGREAVVELGHGLDHAGAALGHRPGRLLEQRLRAGTIEGRLVDQPEHALAALGEAGARRPAALAHGLLDGLELALLVVVELELGGDALESERAFHS